MATRQGERAGTANLDAQRQGTFTSGSPLAQSNGARGPRPVVGKAPPCAALESVWLAPMRVWMAWISPPCPSGRHSLEQRAVRGRINRLKMTRRTMYRRGSIELLRARMLPLAMQHQVAELRFDGYETLKVQSLASAATADAGIPRLGRCVARGASGSGVRGAIVIAVPKISNRNPARSAKVVGVAMNHSE